METRHIGLGKHFWGLAAGLIAFLAGGWLMVAPYALGFQSYGAAWDDQMMVSFWSGLAVAIVALASLGAFTASLLGELRRLGIIQKQQKVARPTQEPVQESAPAPAAGPADDDFERAMVMLASALAEEMAERRQGQAGQNSQERVRTEVKEQAQGWGNYE